MDATTINIPLKQYEMVDNQGFVHIIEARSLAEAYAIAYERFAYDND